jgi:hypothetical protein
MASGGCGRGSRKTAAQDPLGLEVLFFIVIVEHQQCHGISVCLEQPLREQHVLRHASKPVSGLAMHVPRETTGVRCSFAGGEGVSFAARNKRKIWVPLKISNIALVAEDDRRGPLA